MTVDNTSIVIKSYRVPVLFNQFIYTFYRKPKAYKAFHNALKLIQLGIKTPEPIAYVLYVKNKKLKQSYLITSYVESDFSIRDVLQHRVQNTEPILRQFMQFTYHLHRIGVWHSDYSPGNILISQKKDQYELCLVDINRMVFKPISKLEGCKNLNKLWPEQEDLKIISHEYSKLSGLNEHLVYNTIRKTYTSLSKKLKRIKKSIKNFLFFGH